MAETYPPPVDRLLTYGDPRGQREWPNYLDLGLTPEHIPDLIRMATDPDLTMANSESLEVWSPIHAWRALGQLRAEAAVDPLVKLLEQMNVDEGYDEWLGDDLPRAIGMIGPAAIPTLTAYLDNTLHVPEGRTTAANALRRVAQHYPDQRARVVTLLTDALAKYAENDELLNTFLVSELVELEAVESAAVIKAAFYADSVDPSFRGPWRDVKEQLGLSPSAEVPGPEPADEDKLSLLDVGVLSKPARSKSASDRRAKAKRKQEKKSRKQNRRQ